MKIGCQLSGRWETRYSTFRAIRRVNASGEINKIDINKACVYPLVDYSSPSFYPFNEMKCKSLCAFCLSFAYWRERDKKRSSIVWFGFTMRTLHLLKRERENLHMYFVLKCARWNFEEFFFRLFLSSHLLSRPSQRKELADKTCKL